MRVLAIDQGTTSTRGFVVDETGAGKIVCSRSHKQIYPRPGWVEHDPEELLDNISACLQAAGQIDAIGIDNQGESCLAWDSETGAAISPVIVWQDRRTQSVIDKLKADGAQTLTMASAGLPLDPYFSASKFSWILENIPRAGVLLAKGRLRLGTTDAFFIDRLTGSFATDITTASRTSLLNLKTGKWDLRLCELFGVPLEALPQIRPTMGDFGTVECNGREVMLSCSVVDQQASLFGHNCRSQGDAKITFGTGAFALVLTGNSLMSVPDKGILATIAWQGRSENPEYALDGGVYCAGSALNWAKSLGLFPDFSEINGFDAPSAISRNLVFVPALTGLACPYWDGSAAGLWLGLSLETTAMDMVQAVLEGIAFRAAQVIDAMNEEISIGNSISIDGGMSANGYFCQFLSDVLQKRIVVPSTGEITAMGTAMMAMAAAGSGIKNNTAHRSYTPSARQTEGKTLFAEAVQRSRNWRA